MSNHIDSLKNSIEEVRNELIAHPVYRSIHTPEDLKVFMHHHVYAVWDFMSLLKYLQQELTCVTLPWVPVGSANTRFLINEIVTGEESDVDQDGKRISHFELYLTAMKQAGADNNQINTLINALLTGVPVNDAIRDEVSSEAIRAFLQFTFDAIATGKPHVVASVFTFGREDLIPDMFINIVNDLPKEQAEQFSIFKYYLERHIEVDGGHHSHLALEMVQELCGNDAEKWAEATAYAKEALKARIRLWDGVMASLRAS